VIKVMMFLFLQTSHVLVLVLTGAPVIFLIATIVAPAAFIITVGDSAVILMTMVMELLCVS
jgi:hypothetical protein